MPPGAGSRPSGCGPQQGNGLAAKELVSLGNLIDRRAPVEHSQEMSGANGTALLDDDLSDISRRAGDELVVAEGESPGGRRRVGNVRIEALVLGHKAPQAIGYGLR